MKKPRHKHVVPAPQQPQQHNQHIVQRHQVVSAGWSGPLPPPAALEEFNRIVPGGAERIFAQFEAEGKHRRELEQRQSKLAVREIHIGQVLAGLFALGCLAVSAFAIYLDKPWVATIFGSGTIAIVVGAFLRQTRTGDKDKE